MHLLVALPHIQARTHIGSHMFVLVRIEGENHKTPIIYRMKHPRFNSLLIIYSVQHTHPDTHTQPHTHAHAGGVD